MIFKNYISYRSAVFFIVLLTMLGLAAVLSSAVASAATYYINNQVTCSDSYQGMQQTHTTTNTGPWCNVSNVTGKPFAAGDSILLARGATWNNQTMVFTDSGTSVAHITLGDYGGSGNCPSSGNCPKLLGNSTASSRLVKLTNPSYWDFKNLEL